MTVLDATLTDGSKVQYVLTDNPPAGGMKRTYFSPDHSYVVQFYNKKSAGHDPQRPSRLQAILGKYNPTVTQAQGGSAASETSADYFKRLFCWPTGIVTQPDIGIVAPTYPGNYFFANGPFKGKEKEGGWFLGAKTANCCQHPNWGTGKAISACASAWPVQFAACIWPVWRILTCPRKTF